MEGPLKLCHQYSHRTISCAQHLALKETGSQCSVTSRFGLMNWTNEVQNFSFKVRQHYFTHGDTPTLPFFFSFCPALLRLPLPQNRQLPRILLRLNLHFPKIILNALDLASVPAISWRRPSLKWERKLYLDKARRIGVSTGWPSLVKINAPESPPVEEGWLSPTPIKHAARPCPYFPYLTAST